MLIPRSVSAAEAVQLVQSGNRVLLGSGCASPDILISALMERSSELSDVELVHLLTFGIAPYADPKYRGSFRHNAFFIGNNVRAAVQNGDADCTPIFLSEIPDLFVSRQLPIDVTMVMVTPPDSRGYCSVGIHPDILMTGIDCSRKIIAQVNPRMVRVHGDTFVHVSRFDAIVEHESPLEELPIGTTDEVSRAIAGHVAALIENGSTLQLGIGKIPDAVLAALGGHRDLGVHSEMISDGVVDLIESGVITNMKKGLHPGKTVASFAMGTQRLYDYLHDNPFFEFHRTEHVNSPRIISQNQKQVAINSALQVDLTGQVCADSIGPNFYSGFGGQVDFIRGAAMSPGGRPIIALPSTAKKGAASRIVSQLDPGAGVTTSRADVHYVVTEYGTAYLHGKSVRERAMALIEIAHPDFRSELRAAAVGRHLVPVSWELPTEATRYPSEFENSLLLTGPWGQAQYRVRPLRSSDADRLMAFFYSHEPDTVYDRYGYFKRQLHREEALRLCTLDYRRRFALGVFDATSRGEHLTAVARYRTDDRTKEAEVAIVVHEQHRRRGLASLLLQALETQARRQGIVGFYGEVDPENQETIALLERLGYSLTLDPVSQVYRAVYPFAQTSPRTLRTR